MASYFVHDEFTRYEVRDTFEYKFNFSLLREIVGVFFLDGYDWIALKESTYLCWIRRELSDQDGARSGRRRGAISAIGGKSSGSSGFGHFSLALGFLAKLKFERPFTVVYKFLRLKRLRV